MSKNKEAFKKVIGLLISDSVYLRCIYLLKFKRKLNLNNPKLFTEKLQWLKIHDRSSLHTKCADKLYVKEYVAQKIGSQHVIETLKVYSTLDEFTLESLPDFPVIIKTNHDSGGTLLLRDKKSFDFESAKSRLKRKLSINFYYQHREWEYKNIKPLIFLEKLLSDGSGNEVLNDYKIHCFNGKPFYIQTIFDRVEGVKEDWFDTNWNQLDIWYFSPCRNNTIRPSQLTQMLEIAATLSADFIYVRIDLYEIMGKIYFGEFTFHPYGGFMKWNYPLWDMELGKLIILPDNV